MVCYMGGGLLQLFGFFKNHSQLGPKSTRQYCISSKVPVTGQPGWPMTLTASHPARTLLSCTPPSSAAAASPVGLPASPTPKYPHPTTVQQVLAKSRCNMCSKQCLPGTCHHKQHIHRHRHTCNYVRPAYPPRMTAPSPASTHTRSAPPGADCRQQATDPQLCSISYLRCQHR